MLQQARFNPFTFKTTLIGFELRDRDSTALVAFDTLVVNLSLLSIPQRAIVLDEVRLVRPAVVARVLNGGELAIADLVAADSSAAPPADTAAFEEATPRISIRRVGLVDGRFSYVDESRTPRYQEDFTALSAEVAGFSTLPREEGDHDLSVSFANGARLGWSGTSSIRPLQLKGRLSITGLGLARLAELLAGTLPLQLTRGQADLTLEYQADRDSAGVLALAIPDASLILTGLAIRPRDGREDWLRLPRFAVRGVRANWPQRTARVGSVSADSLWVAAARESDGQLSWQRVFAAMPADTAKPDSVPAAPWIAVIDTIALTGGTVALSDRAVTPAAVLTISDILVRLTNIATDSTQRTGVTVGALLGQRGRFTMTGGAVRSPLRADFELVLQGLQVALAQPYLGERPPARLDSGAVSLRGTVRLRDARPRLLFEGGAAIERLGMSDRDGDPLLAWHALNVRGVRLTTGPDLLRIRQVAVDRPFARIAINRQGALNVGSADTVGAAQSAAPADTGSGGFPWELLEFAITNGRIDFSDSSLILPFRTLIDSARVSIRDVASFGATPGSLELEGRVGTAGSAQASGTLRVADPLAATDIRAQFRNVDLPSLTPYSAQFMGYRIRTGVLDADFTYRIHDRTLQAEHHIVATNFNLGEPVEGAQPLGFSVKLALSVLEDGRGRLIIDAPVSGSMDDPEFSYQTLLGNAFKGVLDRVATAPFRFLGGRLGTSGDEPELVDFDPGRSTILAPEKIKLDTLAAELARRPELTIAIEGRYDSTADESAVREAALNTRIAARRDSLTMVARGDTSGTVLGGILDVLYGEQFGRAQHESLRSRHTAAGASLDAGAYYAEVRRQLLVAQPVEAGFLPRLARERAAAIRAVLLAGGTVDAARVTASEPAAAQRRKAGSSRVASELSLNAP